MLETSPPYLAPLQSEKRERAGKIVANGHKKTGDIVAGSFVAHNSVLLSLFPFLLASA